MLEDLKMAISEKNLEKARKIMTEELIGTDYPHEVFKDAMELAESCDLFEKDTSGNVKTEPKEWNMEYLHSLLNELKENFSKEKFMTAYYVARKLEKEMDNECGDKCTVIKHVYNDHKNLVIAGAIGAAIAGISLAALGIYLGNKNRK